LAQVSSSHVDGAVEVELLTGDVISLVRARKFTSSGDVFGWYGMTAGGETLTHSRTKPDASPVTTAIAARSSVSPRVCDAAAHHHHAAAIPPLTYLHQRGFNSRNK
jgi:hypothetical protein